MKKILLILLILSAAFSVSFAVLAQDDDGGGGFTSSSATNNNDCTGGQCGAEVDPCSTSGTQCYTPQYCTEYNTPVFSSALRVTATAGQAFSYEVMVRQVNPNPSRDLSPWEHPLIHERTTESGWYGVNVTSLDANGLTGSGLSANAGSVTVFKRTGVPQVPDSTGLIISGVPTTPGTYSVPLNTRNDLKEWLYGGGTGDNQSSTGTDYPGSGEYVNRSVSCSHGDVLEIVVSPAVCSANTGAPVITSSDTVSGQVGQPFSYEATATNYTSLGVIGSIPGTERASPLRVAGTPTVAGIYTLTINAENNTPGCTPTSATKDVTVTIRASDQCAALTPPFTITSSDNAAAEIGASFGGYTIQTSQSADSYLLTPVTGDTFPASLGVVNERSLEGSIAASQPKQQYRFVASATKNVTSTSSCTVQKTVTLGLTCPSSKPNWNPSTGECQSGPVNPVCTDPQATNYNQPGSCTYGPCSGSGCSTNRCQDPAASNYGAVGACTYCSGPGPGCGGGGYVCADPAAENFGRPGSCRPRTGCGAGETGTPPQCQEIACPNCGQTKMCDVCAEENDMGACIRREMRPASEARSAPNSCGLTRSLFYCPGESDSPPPPPGEEACAAPSVSVNPSREIVQKGGQCSVPWRVSGVPTEQRDHLICVLSGPGGFAVRANGSSGSVQTPPVLVQSVYTFRCRNGISKQSLPPASFTCRVSPRFEER